MSIKLVASRQPPSDLALQQSDKDLAGNIVVTLLVESTNQHVHHLNATDHAAHVVLGRIYGILGEAADRLFEIVKGRDASFRLQSGEVQPVFFETPTVSWSAKSLDDTLSFLERSCQDLIDDHIRTIVEEARADLYRQRYLLGMTAAGVKDPSQPPSA